jgi:hypothetical protein
LPTLTFRILYVLVFIDHGRSELVYVISSPSNGSGAPALNM